MDDICWPSIETIAEKASLTARCVSNHLEVAEKGGWLTRWRSRQPRRKWAHAHYRLSIPKDVALRQRDAIDLDIAANETEPSFIVAQDTGRTEPRSEVAQEMSSLEPRSEAAQDSGNAEPRSGDAHGLQERRSGAAPVEVASGHFPAVKPQSYRNHVLTSKPVNRNTNKPSLSQPLPVNEGKAAQEGNVSQDDAQSNPDAMANWMLNLVRQRLPNFSTPNMPRWQAEIAAMLHDDGHAPKDIARLFRWAGGDRFWSTVITSPAQLRKHWDTLRLKRNASIAGSSGAATAQTAGGGVGSAAADDRQCAHTEDGCRCTRAASFIIGAGLSRRGYCRAHIGLYED
jgi:hypothetical protein